MRPRSTAPTLHACIETCDLRSLETLLAEGADVEARDRWGRTPLHCAVAPYGGWRQGVEVLLAACADPNARTPEGNSVLMELRSGVSSPLEALEADEVERLLRARGARE